MNYWLIKTEPSSFGIDDLARAPAGSTSWDGVRNYQVRNMLRDEMRRGDLAYFYHSSCPQPGIVGIVEIKGAAYPDKTAFDRRDPHYDPRSDAAHPTWYTVDVRLKRRMRRLIELAELRAHRDRKLRDMWLLRTGSRLSISPIERAHWNFIASLE